MIGHFPPALCVVGNKADLSSEREVSRDEGLDFAHEIGAMFTETSAAQNIGMVVNKFCVDNALGKMCLFSRGARFTVSCCLQV